MRSSRLQALMGMVCVALTPACAGHDSARQLWHDEPGPSITISIPESLSRHVTFDSARRITAPAIRYEAIIRLDLARATSVIASGAGEARVLSIASTHRVDWGDTLAVLRGFEVPKLRLLTADREGTWWPHRHRGETVWPGDSVGVIQHEGRFIASGHIDDPECGQLDYGDSAWISLPGRSKAKIRGRVASIRSSTYGATVDVHFHQPGGADLSGSLVEVSAFPSGARGSALVVPTKDIAQLTRGLAIFIPTGHDSFTVQFILADPHETGMSVVHRGLEGPAPIAGEGLAPLLAAAEDTLRARLNRPRQAGVIQGGTLAIGWVLLR